jgi:cytoskeletal protein CcmA (bactofilin family)
MVKVMTDVHSDTLDDGDFDTILTADIDFSGTLSFEKSFLIRGTVSGFIDTKGLLVIDEAAVVEANINAGRVIIRGTVRGDIRASGTVEIAATGKLTGNVTTPAGGFFMENGCLFNGSCTMMDGTE